MRDIKFRVWHSQRKEMYNPMPIVDFKVIEINAHILMQYTGLKDKNGKEIYEGDIIKCLYLKTEYQRDVRYQNAGFTFGNFIHLHGLLPGNPRASEIEVIGNIYENPELINKQLIK